MPRLSRILAVPLLAVVVLSCGTKELSRGGFIDAVNRTCESANSQLDLIDQPAAGEDGSPSSEALAAFLADALEINEDAADGVRAMKVPEDLASSHEQLIAAMDQANAGLAKAAEAAEADDQDLMSAALTELQTGRTAFDSLAAALGIDACRTLSSRG